MASSSRSTSHQLHITIVGGGISGLATAFTLRKAGHHVLVLEKASGSTKGGGGIRAPPNMHRILVRWGLGPQLTRYAIKGSEISFRLASTGEKVGAIIFREEIMKSVGADWLYLQHGDLRSWLTTLAMEAGATIRYGCDVVSIDTAGASVTLSTGAIINSDLVIGANGESGLVQRSITRSTSTINESHFHVFDSCIQADLMFAVEHVDGRWLRNIRTCYGKAPSDLDICAPLLAEVKKYAHESYALDVAAPLHNAQHAVRNGHPPEFDFGRNSLTMEPR